MRHPGTKHWLRRYDWDAIAGIVAAAAALILHLLHVVQPDILLTITLVLVALLLLRQLRHEERDERVEDVTGRTEQMIVKLHDVLKRRTSCSSARATCARRARRSPVRPAATWCGSTCA